MVQLTRLAANASIIENIGYEVQTRGCKLYNRTGATLDVGDVVQVDWTASATETTEEGTSGLYSAASVNGAAVACATADLGGVGKTFVVAAESVADNAAGIFIIEGYIEAYVIKASGSIAAGDGLVGINASQDLDGTVATGEMVLAVALETVTTPTTHELATVWFKGDNGGHGLAL